MAGKVDIVFGNETEEFTLVKVTCNSGYVLNGPEYINCQQGIWGSKFPICTEEEMSIAPIGVGIVCILVLIVVGGVIVIAKKKQVSKKKKNEASLLTALLEEDPMVDLCERKFPKRTVKAWKDITIERELGSGQFGKVYKGFLNTQYTR